MKKSFSIVLPLILVMLLSNCAKNISSSEYSEAEVGAVKQTYRGTVINARNVKVQGADRLQDNAMGLAGGGVAGGVLGSMVGKGHGSTIGMMAGAAAGALGGAMLEKKLKEQNGVEYTVELASGRIMTIVQGPEPRINPGQHVLVMVGSTGRSRVVIDQSGGVSYANRKASSQMGEQNDFGAVDYNHRDAYARDIAERAPGSRVIVQ